MGSRWIARAFGSLDVIQQETYEPPAPGAGEVTIDVFAAGMNPADYKHVAAGDPAALPLPVGYEVAGVISAIGPGTEIASGGGAIGDEVLAFRISGGYATAVTVPAKDVFAKPESLDFTEAANLLLVGTTAAEMLHRTGVTADDTVLLHGASGAVGASVLQQAALIGARVIGTASEASADRVAAFGGIPVAYGDGLEQRVRAIGEVTVALDAVGTDEAIDVSLALVADRDRVLSIANRSRAVSDGFRFIAGALPDSAAFRDEVRPRIIALAAAGELGVPLARTYPLDDAQDAMRVLAGQHPGGKIALLP